MNTMTRKFLEHLAESPESEAVFNDWARALLAEPGRVAVRFMDGTQADPGSFTGTVDLDEVALRIKEPS
jgi:hypothetical protein